MYSELMASRQLFMLALRVRNEYLQASAEAQEEQKSAGWFASARQGDGVNV